MLRAFIKNHKVVSASCVAGAVSSIYLADELRRVKAHETFRGFTRSVDFACTLATILIDYKISFYHVHEDDIEYNNVYHTVNKRCAERALRMFRRLGGFYVKFGQMISTLEQGGIPREWYETMTSCQDKANPVPFKSISRVIYEDLGLHPEDIFESIDEEPIGAASLAQVHHAVLKTGEEVALKIQYPYIRKYTLIDMRDCELATKVVRYLFPSFEFTWFVPRFRENVMREIDFEKEITNIENCRSFFSKNPQIYAPAVYHTYSSKRICMMEFIHGAKVSDVKSIRAMGIHPTDVAKLIVQAFSDMIFQAPFMHVDPHAGNLLVRIQPGGSQPQLVMLDHGMYTYVDKDFTTFVQELWLGMVSQDTAHVKELCKPYGLDKYAQLLALSMTGRSLSSHNKYGEEMTDGLRNSIEERVTNAMRVMSMGLFSKRLTVVSEMMNAMPRDFMYVFRTVEMLKGLVHMLGATEMDRLDVMTSSAIQGKFSYNHERITFFTSLKWKWYVYMLRFKLWLGDLYIDYYIRHFLNDEYRMEHDPDVIFDELITNNCSVYFINTIQFV